MTSCSPGKSDETDKKADEIKVAEKKKEIPKAPSTPKEIIKSGAGIITKEIFEPGKVYDDQQFEKLMQKVVKQRNKKIAEWPKDLSTDEIFNRFVYLFAQNYKVHVDKIKNYEIGYDLSLSDGTPINEYSVDEAVKNLTKP